MDFSSLLLLSTGLGLGLLHAFDADHIMAISSLAQKKARAGSIMLFCARWALGHGGTVCCLAVLFVVFDWTLAEWVRLWAERLVGLILIGVGAVLLYQFIRPTFAIETHQHGEVVHTHLVKKGRVHERHVPVLVGIVHGVAGSAPLLALLPVLVSRSPILGAVYVLIFSMGVLLSMLGFGLLLGVFQNWIRVRSEHVYCYTKVALGMTAMVFGGFWVALSF